MGTIKNRTFEKAEIKKEYYIIKEPWWVNPIPKIENKKSHKPSYVQLSLRI